MIAAAVALVLLVLLAAGAAAYYFAGDAQASAAVQAVNSDIGKVNAGISAVDAITKDRPSYPDFTQSSSPAGFIAQADQYDAAADQALAKIDRLGQVARDDRAVLQDARRRLDSAAKSWLTLPERSRLADGSRRLGLEQQSLDLAAQMAEVGSRQVRTAREAIDGLAAYADMVARLQSGDYAGSLAAYPNVHSLLAKAGTEGAAAHLPPVWATLLMDLDKLVDDTRDGVQAVQNGDSATAEAKASELDADSKALDGLDTSALNSNAYLDGLLAQIRSLEARAR